VASGALLFAVGGVAHPEAAKLAARAANHASLRPMAASSAVFARLATIGRRDLAAEARFAPPPLEIH